MDQQARGGVVALNHTGRLTIDRALHKARSAAFGPGEFVGQEGFMRSSDILRLAQHAGIGPGMSVLDVCCGVGGPGLLIAHAFGCLYHGVDVSASAVRIARSRAGNLNARFDVAAVPPLPPGHYDVVLLLETLLAFRDKPTLLRHVCDALAVGGRFVFSLEEGEPLTATERAGMPDADTVWLTPLAVMVSMLQAAGLRVVWQEEQSGSHREMAERLYAALMADRSNICEHIGAHAWESLLAAHRLWIDWLDRRRVRKFVFVAEK